MAGSSNQRSESFRTELLSPAAAGDDGMVTKVPSWRLNMDDFRLPQRRTRDTSHFGIAYYWNTIRNQKKIAKYYKRQERLLKEFNEVDSYTELGIVPGTVTLTQDEEKEVAKSERRAIYASNIANMIIFIAKVYASVESRSLAVIASTLDSLLDLLSGSILFFTDHAMRTPNHYRYPIGKTRMQPVGIVVFASVMATLGIQILLESARQIIYKTQPEKDPTKQKWMIGIMVSVTVVKLGLAVYCRGFKNNEIIRAYAQDHFFDVITNSIGLASALLAIKFYWWLDPTGAILIAIYTISNWSKTVKENVGALIGKSAPAEYIAKITYMAWNHDEEIKYIDTVRAYKFGSNYFVEVDIVLAADMSLCKAHDIGESLQEKLELLPQVERAFVHLDFDFTHKPEHNLTKSS